MEKDNFLQEATVGVENVFTALVLEIFKGNSKSIRTVRFTEDFFKFYYKEDTIAQISNNRLEKVKRDLKIHTICNPENSTFLQ